MTDVLANGRYQIVRRLAQGGMGEVLLAEFSGDALLGLSSGLLCVKRVLSDHPNRAHQATMLREEGRMALRLLHDNLVETFFIDDHEGDPLLVMEYMSGRALSQVLGQAKKLKEQVPVAVALALLRASACGLHFAPTLTDGVSSARPLGLIHRDVSPANLFMTFDGRIKVIDFGVAKADDSELHTRTGILKGKLGYMSPEHALGSKLTPATDLWSLGVCFWETLCATRLFSAQAASATLAAISTEPIPSPLPHRPDLSPHIIELCMALLQRSLANRMSSGAALVQAIDALPEAGELSLVDLGGWLAARFPEEAESGKGEARRCARLRRSIPVPSGLVEGTATLGPSNEEQPTQVVHLSPAMIAMGLMGDAADAASQPVALHKVVDENAPTKLISLKPKSATSAEEPIALAEIDVQFVTGDIPTTVAKGAAAPSARPFLTSAPQPSAKSLVVKESAKSSAIVHSSSWLANALFTFGAFALVMGIAFSFLGPRAALGGVAVYQDANQRNVVLALRDAPADARVIDIERPALRAPGATRDMLPAELRHQLDSSGVAVRASLPTSARGTLAIFLPVLIAALGLLALAIATPLFFAVAVSKQRLLQAVLALVCLVAIAAVFEKGARPWPGYHAWRSVPRLEVR